MKRKDPELLIIIETRDIILLQLEYPLTILNSNYEEWRMENPEADIDEFKLPLRR